MLIAPIFLAAWVPTDKSRELATDIFGALDSVYSRKEAAALMGVTEKLLSDWAQCQKPLNWFRFGNLDGVTEQDRKRAAQFWDALQQRMAERAGGVYVRPQLVTLLRAAATFKRTPLKSLFPIVERTEVA